MDNSIHQLKWSLSKSQFSKSYILKGGGQHSHSANWIRYAMHLLFLSMVLKSQAAVTYLTDEILHKNVLYCICIILRTLHRAEILCQTFQEMVSRKPKAAFPHHCHLPVFIMSGGEACHDNAILTVTRPYCGCRPLFTMKTCRSAKNIAMSTGLLTVSQSHLL